MSRGPPVRPHTTPRPGLGLAVAGALSASKRHVYSFRCVDRCLHMESTIGLRVGCVNNAAGWRRRQFPIRPAFAMTINKAQGQTLQHVGVLLDEPVFTHGQLYVAASRCGDPTNIKFFANNGQTANVVYTEVLC